MYICIYKSIVDIVCIVAIKGVDCAGKHFNFFLNNKN